MEMITCPDHLGNLPLAKIDWPSLFMAGGISNCPDWQTEFGTLFENHKVVLVNPRRNNFDMTDPAMSVWQIGWEHDHLTYTKAAAFWFPCETLCPITLFELGKLAAQGKEIYVGCHPDYARKLDVEHQLKLMGHTLPIVDNLVDLAAQVLQSERFRDT